MDALTFRLGLRLELSDALVAGGTKHSETDEHADANAHIGQSGYTGRPAIGVLVHFGDGSEKEVQQAIDERDVGLQFSSAARSACKTRKGESVHTVNMKIKGDLTSILGGLDKAFVKISFGESPVASLGR